MVPRTGLEPVRLVGYATNTGGVATPCVYQFHHLGKNNPSLSGDGFFYCPLIIYTPLIPQSKTFAILWENSQKPEKRYGQHYSNRDRIKPGNRC